ncbi:MAG: aminotransferase class V-fold PLP-dependent enzyme [Verrucomicrobiales bacterium]|nr:aminotransferase class V-fold PLP-dependent enzyme [Verrucomicrobiales bacterium]
MSPRRQAIVSLPESDGRPASRPAGLGNTAAIRDSSGLQAVIYLDNNATTRIHPAVRDAMLPWLSEEGYGNPSAGYRFGKAARQAVDRAREQVAALIDADPEEIVFTSGGTESNNTALLSALRTYPDRRRLVTSTVEHSAVENPCAFFDETGYHLRRNPVDASGRLDLDALRDAITPGETAIVSVIWANNETGVLSPVAEAAAIAREAGALFHTDAVQAVGKLPVSVRVAGVDLLSLSGHKFHAPKGIGALYVSRRIRFAPMLLGGGQEGGRRSGTENVAGIVALGAAAELMRGHLADGLTGRLEMLRDRFEAGVRAAVDGVEVNGDASPGARVTNTSNLYFPGVDGEGLLILLDEAGVCCSPGSACGSGSVKPSRVLKAMGHSTARARGSVRFSVSLFTTGEEIDAAVAAVAKAVGKLRVVMPTGGSRVVSRSR